MFNMKQKKFSKLIQTICAISITAILTQGFISCSSDEGVTDPDPATSTGVFLDAEVEGLTFQSGDGTPATTDENGRFEYTPGQTLSFSVGGVQLGTLDDGAAVCTPNDFLVPENIARFLQSLDGDGDPSNGIDVTAAATALAGVTVASGVFEETNSTTFETNTDITGALTTAGETLIDATTANNNLNDGTDSTFSVAELAGKVFILVEPDSPIFGIVKFDALANSGDLGSTGSNISGEDFTGQGGLGIDEEFTWAVDANGVLTLDYGDEIVIVKRVGGSSRSVSVVATAPGEAPAVITLLKPIAITETSICGAPITQNGTLTKTYTVTDANGPVSITFKADGTMTSTEGQGAPEPGFWTVSELAPNVLKVSDLAPGGSTPDVWALVVFLEGSPATGGQLLELEVRFTGFDVGTTDPNVEWDEIFFSTIAPVIF